MDFRVELLHADSQRRVVRVRAFEAERCLGSALGEAGTAEEAEDRALDRLCQRLQTLGSPRWEPISSPKPPSAEAPPSPLPAPQPAQVLAPVPAQTSRAALMGEVSQTPPDGDAASDPEDWGADLAGVDFLLKHLAWGREEERIYMERLFGFPSRSRLTRYADLMLLRRALEALAPGADPGSAPLPLRRSDLLAQCDSLLAQLGWTTDRARQCLEKHFAVTSRQLLQDQQLLAFNLLLEEELLEPLAQTFA